MDSLLSFLSKMSATLTKSISSPSFPTSKVSKPANARSSLTKISTINELLINRADTIPDTPLVAYPASARGSRDYVNYTAKDLDRFADEAAIKLTALGLQLQVRIGDALGLNTY
jgi:hypothetical protein